MKGSTTVLPSRANPSTLPGLSRKLQLHPTPRHFGGTRGTLPWSCPAHGKTLLQGFGCFSSLTSWSRTKGTEPQRSSELVCLLMFRPKHSHPPLLPHAASLLRPRRAPRSGVSEMQGCCQEKLIQPTGGLLSAPFLTHPTTTSQAPRSPERTGPTAPTPSGSAAPHLRRWHYFLL